MNDPTGLRVLMLAATAIHGGQVVQMEKTAASLATMGIDVTVSEATGASVAGYDIVHAFGTPWPFRDLLREARQAGSSIVMSPIFLDWSWTLGRRGWNTSTRAARIAYSALRRGIDRTAEALRRSDEETAMALELADLLLPNSQGEAERVRSIFRVTTPMRVVPNGFDPDVFHLADGIAQRHGVLCVARLEPIKNQLALIDALSDTGIPLTIVGNDHPDHRAYTARCRAQAGANVVFRTAVTQRELADIYRNAAVHVLPSWFETTGLVSLEAAACGCAVVTTSRGAAREYFGDLATYCDPAREGSIREAIEHALATGAAPELAAHVREHFTWEHAARATLEAYTTVRRP